MMVRTRNNMSLASGQPIPAGSIYWIRTTVAANGGREWRYVLEHYDGSVAFHVSCDAVEFVQESVTADSGRER